MRLASRLSDVTRPEHAALSAALVAGLTLVEPRALSRGGKLAYRAALAGYMTWTTWAELRRQPMLDPVAQVALSAGAGGLAFGAAEAGEAMDARVADRLESWGVRRPRVALALGAGVLTLGTWWATRNDEPFSMLSLSEDSEDSEDVMIADVPSHAVALVTRLLSTTDSWGAAELRDQLSRAQAVTYSFEDPDEAWPVINFQVPDDMPLAVPLEGRFPVVGRYADAHGQVLEVALRVGDGVLATLDLQIVDDGSSDDNFEELPMPTWPDASELTLWVDSPRGAVPVA